MKRLDGTHAWGQTLVVASKGQTKIEVSGKAAQVRFLTGQREDNGPLFTGSMPD
jgi:hypothetical protein